MSSASVSPSLTPLPSVIGTSDEYRVMTQQKQYVGKDHAVKGVAVGQQRCHKVPNFILWRTHNAIGANGKFSESTKREMQLDIALFAFSPMNIHRSIKNADHSQWERALNKDSATKDQMGRKFSTMNTAIGHLRENKPKSEHTIPALLSMIAQSSDDWAAFVAQLDARTYNDDREKKVIHKARE